MDNLTVLITPPLGLKKTVYEQLQQHFNVVEQSRFNAQTIAFNGKHQKNLVIVNSFQGLPKAKKDIKFYLFGLRESTKPDDIAKNVYLQEEYRIAPELKNINAPFIRSEVTQMIADAAEMLSKLG